MKMTTTTVDSALGRWTHSEARVARLSHVVDHLWLFTGRAALPRERLFPAGYLEIILHLGPRFSDVDARGATAGEFPLACVSGLLTRPAVIEAPAGECRVLGIRLRPLGAFALFGPVVCDALDQTVDLRDVTDRNACDLAERCSESASALEAFEHVTRWIDARLAHAPAFPNGLAWVARSIEQSDGMAAIGELRDRTGLSRARLVEAFRRHTGLTPKRYARMLRFRRALSLLQSGENVSHVALATGYFDQSHLNADFREFASMTPGEFMRARRYPGSVSLQEE